MHRRHKYDIIVILALAVFGISFYLTITHYLGYAVPCDVTHGCETVLHSKYSMLLGLPLSLWGTAYSALVIAAALLANHYKAWGKILTVMLMFSALFSLGLLFAQFFIIKQVCQYCLAADLLNILLFILDINIEKQA